ncbi:MAG TPA: hypothetical protein VKY27_10385 [Bacteriovoracaceae bacterium]|nr:hypothetical protein [Bacteriovoracaceae bacterium]
MAIISNISKEAKEKRENDVVLQHKYNNRITITRHGKEAFDNGEYAIALSRYKEYLETVSEVKEAGTDIYSLRPSHFDPEKDLTEMLMISQIYLELARIYDAVPKYKDELHKSLDQFLNFTINQPYQVINSEILRKHIKRGKFRNYDTFRDYYQQIAIQSKKCYIVTFSLGNDHPVTQEYRLFKEWLLDFPLGQELVRLYYLHSSVLVERWGKGQCMHFIGKYFLAPLLTLFSKTILRRIVK